MKHSLLLISGLIGLNMLYAQNTEKAEDLIREGIVLHDQGKYKDAVKKYDKALEADTFNITALAEKAMSLTSLAEYDEAIKVCKLAIKKHPESKSLNNIYVHMGTCYDYLNKPERSLETYNEGITKFPESYMLHFNKGVTLYGMKNYDDALLSLENAIICNPNHAGSHNLIAGIDEKHYRNVRALLATIRFLIVEPEGSRAASNLERLKTIMYGGMKKTGKNTYTLNINSLGSLNKDSTVKENDFSETEMTLSIMSLLGAAKSKMKDVEMFQVNIESFIKSLEDNQKGKTGFYWEYYVPYFLEMKEKKHLETLSYLVFASSGDKSVIKWIKNNGDAIKKFYNWSENYVWTEE